MIIGIVYIYEAPDTESEITTNICGLFHRSILKTTRPLDYEKHKIHHVTVTASDGHHVSIIFYVTASDGHNVSTFYVTVTTFDRLRKTILRLE